MLKKLSDLQKGILFSCITLVLSTSLTLLLPDNVDIGILMFVPLLVVLVTMLLTGEIRNKQSWLSLGFHRFPMKVFLIGFIVPIIPTLIGYIIVWNTGLGDFTVPEEMKLNVFVLIIGAVITIIINSLTKMLGEEIGWRGYLLPRLQSLGIENALFISSFIWGLFHIAPIMFSGQYHSETNFFIFVPLFMINVMMAGYFIGYLRIVTGSIWPAIIAHCAHNMAWAYGSMLTTNADPIVSYVTGDVGVIGLAFYFVVYLVIRRDLKKRRAMNVDGISIAK